MGGGIDPPRDGLTHLRWTFGYKFFDGFNGSCETDST